MSDRIQRLKTLLHLLRVTAEEEIDCDEFLQRVAGFVEHMAEDSARRSEFASVLQHLEVCPECAEEFRMVLRLYKESL